MALHPFLAEELRRYLDGLTPDMLKIMAESEPEFRTGGFRATKPELLRTRLLHVMTSSTEHLETMRQSIIRQTARKFSIAGLLSERILLTWRNELAAVFGEAHFAMMCWLDEREAVHKAANEWLEKSSVFEPVEHEVAAQRLRDLFARVLATLGAESTDGAPRSHEAWQTERRKLKEETAQLHEENRRLKGVEDRATRQRERADKAEAAMSAALREKRDLEADIRRLTREREDAREELARDKKFRETHLAALHEAEMAKTFEGWLNRATEVEAETKKDADLLKRAEAALAQQAALERHSSNRAALQTRREKVEKLRERVAAALNDAIRPTAALLNVAQELQNEARHLATLLAVEREPETPFEHAFALHAHKADEATLYHLTTLLDRMEEISALEPAALKRLRDVLAMRQTFFHATAGDPEKVGETTEAVAMLRRALLGRKGVFLLIDGHNIFFALQGKYAAPTGPVIPDREKRARFVADVTRVAASRPTCRVWIIFDGPVRSEESPAPNVRVIYSGGTGEHRADKVLAETVRFVRAAEPGVPAIVATNDNELRGETKKLGAMNITAAELGNFL